MAGQAKKGATGAVEIIDLGGDDGYAIGAEIDGYFVPFVTMTRARATQLAERQADLEQRDKDGEGS